MHISRRGKVQVLNLTPKTGKFITGKITTCCGQEKYSEPHESVKIRKVDRFETDAGKLPVFQFQQKSFTTTIAYVMLFTQQT